MLVSGRVDSWTWKDFYESQVVTVLLLIAYQIDPREAVPEVSKSKGYINQEKMCL